MIIYPAIDLFGGEAVRLFRGDYNNMTVYSSNPVSVAADFVNCGARYIHIVDLEGARDGTTPNIEIIKEIVSSHRLFAEVGGGIRNIATAERYFEAGVSRVILGTSAVTDELFLREAVNTYKEKIAVGIDIKDGCVAIKGWQEKSEYTFDEFCARMQDIGVESLICTDITRDGAMQGTNRELYRMLSEKYSMHITASGGVSSLEDIVALKNLGIYGAIIGKAYYTGAIDLKKAIEVAE